MHIKYLHSGQHKWMVKKNKKGNPRDATAQAVLVEYPACNLNSNHWPLLLIHLDTVFAKNTCTNLSLHSSKIQTLTA